jgi:hypothetical protein
MLGKYMDQKEKENYVSTSVELLERLLDRFDRMKLSRGRAAGRITLKSVVNRGLEHWLNSQEAVPLQPGSTIASDGPKAIESPNLGEISGERKEWVLKLLRILQSKEEEVIQQTIHIIELGVERINAGSDVSIAQSARDHIDAPVKGAGTHRKKSGRASGK